MGKRTIGVIAAALMTLLLLPGTALAEEPADVDCDLLEATLDEVDDFLDAAGSTFPNLGKFVSAMVTNETTFNSFNGIVESFSDGQISFMSGTQVLPTVAACGLTTFLIDNIND